MPLPVKVQPIASDISEELTLPEPMRQMPKSRIKRLFDRQFTGVLKNSAATEPPPPPPQPPPPAQPLSRGNSSEFEPSSVCLAKMVQNFIEDNNNNNSEKQRYGRNHCSCFSGSGTDSSDDEWEPVGGGFNSSGEACETLKSLVLCTSICERNLLTETAKIVEKNKNLKRKDESSWKLLADGLVGLGYDATLCKSRWEKSPSCPAGEYEYVDVIFKGERFLIDIDFRSEFEIARPTKSYKSILQILPYIFVGRADRLQRIILIVSEAAKLSLKKKGLHVPPWRKAEYVRAKWLSPNSRADQTQSLSEAPTVTKQNPFEGIGSHACSVAPRCFFPELGCVVRLYM
ncbi:PREDICTED: uncharacterized protein LOC104800024 isoform X2 [Tarenaya hassleriana]|uniref:uncharacterized protein LOC104800024 isoform X2 n=1 Tax=Tarenaya hassleriana TaxID=28532 RepID=UPI00053C2FF9|nr:PREDICTED: uncharacterized protein LOC104800024 isoform X2 [Tarenaya hassleriana]